MAGKSAGSATRATPRSCRRRSKQSSRRPESQPPTSRISSCRVRLRSSISDSPSNAASIRPRCATISRRTVGDAGSAHALLMLVHVLEQAKPGEKILVAQFGQGCDALLFEATPQIARTSEARSGVTGSLARRKEETNYNKYLAFNGLIELEKGMRAEIDKRTALTVLYRKNDMLLGLVGGKCRVCGTAQFPHSRDVRGSELQSGGQPGSLRFLRTDRHGAVLVGGLPHLFDVSAQPLWHDHLRRGRPLHGGHHRCRAGAGRFRDQGAHGIPHEGFRRSAAFVRYFWKAVPI